MWSPFDICETGYTRLWPSYLHFIPFACSWRIRVNPLAIGQSLSLKRARELPDIDESVNDVAVHHRKRVAVR